MLYYNLKDNVNAYILKEDGNYSKKTLGGHVPFNVHKEFFKVKIADIYKAKLFSDKPDLNREVINTTQVVNREDLSEN